MSESGSDQPDAPTLGPPMNRMAIAVLALAGFFVALYLFAHNIGLTGPIVCGVGDCGTVQASPYAKIGPIPVSLVGVLGYVAIFSASFLGIQPGRRASAPIGAFLFLSSLGGVSYSGYLTFLEAYVINAWCQYCVISAIIMVLIFSASLPELRHMGRRAS